MTKQEVLEACINKELEKYDLGFNDVKKGSRYEYYNYNYIKIHSYLWGLIKLKGLHTKKIPWYQAYTFDSPEEYSSWKEFCINLFRTELKLTKKKAEEQFVWLDFNYGLKQNYELPK